MQSIRSVDSLFLEIQHGKIILRCSVTKKTATEMKRSSATKRPNSKQADCLVHSKRWYDYFSNSQIIYTRTRTWLQTINWSPRCTTGCNLAEIIKMFKILKNGIRWRLHGIQTGSEMLCGSVQTWQDYSSKKTNNKLLHQSPALSSNNWWQIFNLHVNT